MNNGWTGGQYSVFRALFGTYLFVHFVQLIPWAPELFSNQGVLPDGRASPVLLLFPNVLALADSPGFVVSLLVLAAGASLFFVLGWHDRPAALVIWYVWACLFGRNPLISNPSLPFVGWMLLAHVFLPPAPFGSRDARGRPDPGGGWHMPPGIFAAAWIILALGYTYSGWTKLVSPSWRDGTALARVLDNPLARPGPLRTGLLSLPPELLHLATWGALGLELGFAPLALFRRVRPWLWGLMLSMHLGLIVLIDFADLSLGMVMIHLFTADPAWLRPRGSGQDRIFYEGSCGLTHPFVRFVLAEDRSGSAFRFAPLGGETFQAAASAKEGEGRPHSLVVLTADGALLRRSAAVLHVLGHLGGLWRLLAGVGRLVPAGLRDGLYDGVVRIRRRLFRPTPVAESAIPAELCGRFDP
jgi:predicted DCC family thiol-disulfide oxidoreductase YuxK